MREDHFSQWPWRFWLAMLAAFWFGVAARVPAWLLELFAAAVVGHIAFWFVMSWIGLAPRWWRR